MSRRGTNEAKNARTGCDVEDLHEQLLFMLRYDAPAAELTAVLELPKPRPGDYRGLVRLTFRGVSGALRERGSHRELGGTWEYQLQLGRPFVLQHVRCTGRHVEAWFGTELGGVNFTFGDLTVERMWLRASKVGDDWKYFLEGTDREVDLFREFIPTRSAPE